MTFKLYMKMKLERASKPKLEGLDVQEAGELEFVKNFKTKMVKILDLEKKKNSYFIAGFNFFLPQCFSISIHIYVTK